MVLACLHWTADDLGAATGGHAHAVRRHRHLHRHAHPATGGPVRRPARRAQRWPRPCRRGARQGRRGGDGAAGPARQHPAGARHAGRAVVARPLRPRALRGQDGRRHRQRRQDHDQGDAAHHLRGVRADLRLPRVLQQPMGRAADARAHARRHPVLRGGGRHQPPRRNPPAVADGAAGCRRDHRDRGGAYRPLRQPRSHCRRKERDRRRPAAGRLASRCCRRTAPCSAGSRPAPPGSTRSASRR